MKMFVSILQYFFVFLEIFIDRDLIDRDLIFWRFLE